MTNPPPKKNPFVGYVSEIVDFFMYQWDVFYEKFIFLAWQLVFFLNQNEIMV